MAYISTETLKLAVNKLAIESMLPIVPVDTSLDSDQLTQRNVFAACYNDSVRCFADMLNIELEEAEKKE